MGKLEEKENRERREIKKNEVFEKHEVIFFLIKENSGYKRHS